MTDVHHRAGPARAIPGYRAIEHRFEVPLAPQDDRRIEVFAREIRAATHADEERPYLLKLNGGPGFPCIRPEGPGNWLARALEEFHVLLLDQRGTGLSTPVTPDATAEYLTHFRADAIVRDAEHIRRELIGDRTWAIFGQSFGGFTSMAYLSNAPEGLTAAYITGGLAPIGRDVDDVYRKTFARLDERIADYLGRYPEDREVWERASRRHRRLGIDLGRHFGPEQLHYLAEHARASEAVFEEHARQSLDHTDHPLYAILHEASWADGTATRWSAQRVLDQRDDPLLYGEHVFPWQFDDEPSLRPYKAVAEQLAEHEWPRQYDAEQLARNEVPVTAAIYLPDMYVEAQYSLETAKAIKGLRPWITNEFHHDGLRQGPVLDRLIRMERGEV